MVQNSPSFITRALPSVATALSALILPRDLPSQKVLSVEVDKKFVELTAITDRVAGKEFVHLRASDCSELREFATKLKQEPELAAAVYLELLKQVSEQITAQMPLSADSLQPSTILRSLSASLEAIHRGAERIPLDFSEEPDSIVISENLCLLIARPELPLGISAQAAAVLLHCGLAHMQSSSLYSALLTGFEGATDRSRITYQEATNSRFASSEVLQQQRREERLQCRTAQKFAQTLGEYISKNPELFLSLLPLITEIIEDTHHHPRLRATCLTLLGKGAGYFYQHIEQESISNTLAARYHNIQHQVNELLFLKFYERADEFYEDKHLTDPITLELLAGQIHGITAYQPILNVILTPTVDALRDLASDCEEKLINLSFQGPEHLPNDTDFSRSVDALRSISIASQLTQKAAATRLLITATAFMLRQ